MSARDVIARAVICDWQTADEDSRDYGLDLADAILAALDAAGKAVVDKEPRPAMVHAAPGRPNQATEESMYHGIWRAMLAAAKEGEP